MNREITLRNQGYQPTMSIRKICPQENLPKTIGESYEKIMYYLKEHGTGPSDAPYVAYLNMDLENPDMEHLDVEIGFPVMYELPGNDEIKPGKYAEGPIASYTYKGPYKDMNTAYDAMFKWIAENGYVTTGVYYEVYLNAPTDVQEADYLTRIEIPVKKA